MRLENKVALISGGARGIGAAEAKLFAREGAKVVIGDIQEEDGRRTEAEINKTGAACLFVKLDVTRAADWRDALAATLARFGKLNVLVNNAGIATRGTIEEFSEEDWDWIVAVNMKSVFLGTKVVIPAMREAGGGSIINTSSGAGIAPSLGTSAPYAATKGAVRIFSKATAIQYAREKIRCNSVHPGPIDTDMIQAARPDAASQKENLARVPMGRLGTAEEIAYGVLYLASDESSFVTGSELVIDGGRTAQ
jgi:NAD(P)-dependent dehydrogenase (short-subunit alcohol dehydrogenase family)